ARDLRSVRRAVGRVGRAARGRRDQRRDDGGRDGMVKKIDDDRPRLTLPLDEDAIGEWLEGAKQARAGSLDYTEVFLLAELSASDLLHGLDEVYLACPEAARHPGFARLVKAVKRVQAEAAEVACCLLVFSAVADGTCPAD